MNILLIATDPRPGAGLVDADSYTYLLKRKAQLLTPLPHTATDDRGWLRDLTRHVASLVTTSKLVVTKDVTPVKNGDKRDARL